LLRYTRGTLARRLDHLAPPGPILDVGSGDGALLEALARRGRRAVGLEPAEKPVVATLDVRAIDIVDFDDRIGQWAAVVFWHSLEHLREPRLAIAQATELLAPSGRLIVAVPNRASWQARTLGSRWLALDLPRHLVHLPARALVDGIRGAGLTVERVSYWRGGQVMFGWLDGLVSALPSHPSLYDAIRRSEARAEAMDGNRRLATLGSAAILSPLAGSLALAEIVSHAGGSVYVEARKPFGSPNGERIV
jgi:SAM-dependent methyltransferase